MSKYELHIQYKEGFGYEKLKEMKIFDNMMDATMYRLKIQDNKEIESIKVLPHEKNDFPFDEPEMFDEF